ncbi:MAG: Ldh family oxidoreductase [Vulcanimicrobiaceae bacterium]
MSTTAPETVRQSTDTLLAFGSELAQAQGMNAEDARTLVEIMVRCDARGVSSHGIYRLPSYLRKMAGGGIDPKARPEIVRESAATAVVDAHHASGYVAGRFAMSKAVTLAEQFGIGAVGVRNSNHFGATGAYVLQAAECGMIGIATTNASACMAPWGGITRMLGNNPLAFAAPRAGGDPFVLDFALSQVAKGWVRLAHAAKRAIPAGWAMDAQGRPTTDSAEAMRGLLAPIGMYKGTGLSIAMDLLAGLLVGSTSSAELAPHESTDVPGTTGHFFLALQIERFIALTSFQAKAGAMLDRIENSARATGVDRILIPGKFEADMERLAAHDGITIALETWNELLKDARRLGVTPPH